MDKRWAVVAVLFGLINGPAVQAQGMSGWVEPDQQRIAVLDDSHAPQQVRFKNGWETADYVPFTWHELNGELVYVTAHDGTAIDFSLTAAEIPRLFRLGEAGELTYGKSGRGRALLGSTFGQRFTVAGLDLQCFSFQSNDVSRPGNAPGLSRRALFGYACSPAETPRPRIDEFLRAIRFVDAGFVEDDEPMSASVGAGDARQFALGREGQGPIPHGLVEVPLGYAVPDPVGGG